MSTDIFSKTMIEAIRKYRETLRKYLPQGPRMQRLRDLGLKSEQLNNSATSLYETGYLIVKDIYDNFDQDQTGYYSYNGVKKFADYLKTYLDQFEVIKDRVIHKSQLASQALVKCIQLLSAPSKDSLTIKMVTELSKCIRTISAYGSQQQKDLLERTLNKIIAEQEAAFSGENENDEQADLSFYQSVLEEFRNGTELTEQA